MAHLSDEQIGALHRGGHDPAKVYAAYAAALRHRQAHRHPGQDGQGLRHGRGRRGRHTNHQQKKMADPAVRAFRDRFSIPVPDDQLEQIPYIKPAPGSAEQAYFDAAIQRAGGHLPRRPAGPGPLATPPLEAFASLLKSSEGREFSTTLAFVRLLGQLLKDPGIGKRVVPIVPDESRTFGMDAMFRQVGIYSHVGQLYTPQDADQLNVYREDRQGRSCRKASTSPAPWHPGSRPPRRTARMGWRRSRSTSSIRCSASSAWATWPGPPATSARAVFLLGATSGRTTLEGEGLQHDDGHSHVLASVIPSCRAYDPAYAYEIAVIVQDGMRRMYQEQEDVFYYLT